MGEVPLKKKGESNDDFLERLVDSYNSNLLVGSLFKPMTMDRAKKMRKPLK